MIDLFNTKQLPGESFKVFLQRWRRMFAKYHRDIPDKEKTNIFINSLSKPMDYWLQLQGPKDFKTTLENAPKVEETLINNDIIKLSKDGKGFSNNSTQTHNSFNRSIDKQKSWWRNNNFSIVLKCCHPRSSLQNYPTRACAKFWPSSFKFLHAQVYPG